MIEASQPSPGLHGPPSVPDLLAFERLLSELSARFIDLPASEIDAVIEDGLRRVVETLDIDRSTLTQFSPDTGQLHSTHSWAAEGALPTPTSPWPREAFTWLISIGRAGKPLVFSSLSELPPAASAERLAYQSIGVRSHVAQPLIVGGELIGFLGFATLRRERAWPHDLVARMRALADVFASALARKRAQEALDHALGFEQLATRILASLLIGKPANDDRAIELGLREIGLFLGVERTTLWERLPGHSEFRRTHLWRAENVAIPADRITPVHFPWISARLVDGSVVSFARRAELPPEAAADLPMLNEVGVRSLLAVPFSVSGEVAGALFFANTHEDRAWPEGLVPGVRLLAEVFASLHARQAAERRKEAAELEAAHWRERLAHVVRVHTVGEMSAALAHEITQPLGAIENYALAARRRAAEPSPDLAKVVDLLDKVVCQATRAGDVVMRLRGLAKRHDLDLREIDVERAARACIDMVKSDCELRDIRVELKPAAGVPAVVADEIHVQQVILNLLRNAMEAMGDRRSDFPRVITVETGLSGPDAVSVRVADRGPGIPDSDLERVFESFYSTKPAGLGIGLAICRKLIEAHGGALWASDNSGGGAVFQFTLPVRAPGA
jgi:signal transduction histidine kinase